MWKLLWAECQKIRRSKIVWITVFASIMIAVIVFAGGQDVYNDPDLHYGLKSVYDGSRYIDNAGWYMDAVQPWSTFFVLPAVIALLGSYIIVVKKRRTLLNPCVLFP